MQLLRCKACAAAIFLAQCASHGHKFSQLNEQDLETSSNKKSKMFSIILAAYFLLKLVRSPKHYAPKFKASILNILKRYKLNDNVEAQVYYDNAHESSRGTRG